MAPFAGAGAGERHAGAPFAAGLVQAFHQVVRQERAVARYAEQPFDAVVLRRQPVEPGQNAGERADKARHVVGYDGQACIGEALRIAIGVDDDAAALPRQSRQHAVEDRHAADLDARLVAAAHAARQSAGKDEAEGGGNGDFSHYSSCTAALRRCLLLSSSTEARSWSNTMRSSPASATKRLPRARPISVRLALRASSTPHAVKPEREMRIGIPMRTHLITISEVSRPVV